MRPTGLPARERAARPRLPLRPVPPSRAALSGARAPRLGGAPAIGLLRLLAVVTMAVSGLAALAAAGLLVPDAWWPAIVIVIVVSCIRGD